MSSILDRLTIPTEDTGDDERIHVYVGLIFLFLLVYLMALKKGLGNRAL